MVVVARASFAQERVFLDQQIRFSFKQNHIMYTIPLLYRISSHTCDELITRLYRALQAVVTKHSALRTALYLDTNGILMQHRLDFNHIFNVQQQFRFTVAKLYDNDKIEKQIKEIVTGCDLFDLAKGHLMHCHILQQNRNDHLWSRNDDLLVTGDLILLNVHHSAFDGASVSRFLHDLCLAYDSDGSLPTDDDALQYIDYAVHERLIDMTPLREFWHSQLEGYNMECPLSLPIDRYRLLTDQRSTASYDVEVTFDKDILTAFLSYASLHGITPFQLALSTFYVFLFKLTNGQNDLCMSCLNANRYRNELQNIIGMFVATLPYRIHLEPHWSFDELAKHVREKCLSILEHSQYPLQHILADNRLNHSNVPFIETFFQLATFTSDYDLLTLHNASLELVPLSTLLEEALFDFELSFLYNPTSDHSGLSCNFVGSCDLFDETKFNKITRCFKYFYSQLFTISSGVMVTDKFRIPIKNLSLVLPEEVEEMQIVFCRLPYIDNEGMFITLYSFCYVSSILTCNATFKLR